MHVHKFADLQPIIEETLYLTLNQALFYIKSIYIKQTFTYIVVKQLHNKNCNKYNENNYLFISLFRDQIV